MEVGGCASIGVLDAEAKLESGRDTTGGEKAGANGNELLEPETVREAGYNGRGQPEMHRQKMSDARYQRLSRRLEPRGKEKNQTKRTSWNFVVQDQSGKKLDQLKIRAVLQSSRLTYSNFPKSTHCYLIGAHLNASHRKVDALCGNAWAAMEVATGAHY
ncbi:hypothetical protein B0H19DRAFT_1065313 [Mycena capillaripes]|nr:hypothetical protein B0H19DRAFT_1065313 [Mycena capillaripes]